MLYQKKAPQSGFTLMEVIVGIALSLGVLGAVLSVYIPTVRTSVATNNLSDLQDNEAILHNLFGNNIRQAGILGCDGTNNIVDGLDDPVDIGRNAVQWAFPDPAGAITNGSFLRQPFLAIASSTAATDTNLSSDLQTLLAGLDGNRLKSGTTNIGDIFYTLAPTTGFFRIQNSVAIAAPGNNTITFQDANVATQAGDFYLINDCDNTVLARANNSSTGSLIYANNTRNNFIHPANTVVTRFMPSVFYLGALDVNGTNIPTLYQRTIITSGSALVTNDSPIVTGVDNLRVEYGVAANTNTGVKANHVVSYVTANNLGAATIADIWTVRVTVMLRSTQNVSSNSSQKALLFPNLANPIVFSDCYAANPDLNACPAEVTNTAGNIARKVVSFSFQLPRVKPIILI